MIFQVKFKERRKIYNNLNNNKTRLTKVFKLKNKVKQLISKKNSNRTTMQR